MRAINHAMTGAIIGLSIANPVALPLAFVSHYVLDGLPHHGSKKGSIESGFFKFTLALDTVLCISLVVVIGFKHPAYWWLAAVCAFLAASPDFMWLGDFIAALHGKTRKELRHRHRVVQWHNWVQWFEKPIGIIIELVWAAAASIFLIYLL